MASPLNLHRDGRVSEEVKTSHEESEAIAGDTIRLIIALPDGRRIEDDFKGGVNVEWVIYKISSQTDYQFEAIELFFEGRKLLGPLSLSDYPQIQSGAVLTARVAQEEQKNN
ncbi:unnamed protein product [Blepharisma stoltei]|uniref:Ubiquitin-like domain-containing protein n=1 Tax=Blepharisma stoltei TaxID=1481888 RepID=A0AAU9K6F9_9CILI|nr:unnamed protein product [Blepharisma stoltei]